MAEKSSSQYKNIIIALYKIQEAAQENVHLWNDPSYIPHSTLPLFSVIRHEEPEDIDVSYYGIMQNGESGRIVFCFANGRYDDPLERGKGDKIGVRELADEIEIHNQNKAGITPMYLYNHFLEQMKEPIKKYELSIADIAGKVKKKLGGLERELKR